MQIAVRPFAIVQALRALAALTVVVYHSAFYVRGQLPDAPTIPWAGEAGVWLFFGISGFVMMHVLDSDPKRTWQRFALHRAVRIAPLYWAMTGVAVVSVVAGTHLVPTEELSVGLVLRSLFFLPSTNPEGLVQPLWPVGWTLILEVAFYALVTAARALRVDALALCAPVLVASAAIGAFRPGGGSSWWLYADPIVLFFLAGMVIARTRSTHTALPIAAVATLAVAFATARSLRFDTLDVGSACAFVALMGLLFVAVRIEGACGNRVPRWSRGLGDASYSLYLTHPLIGPVVTIAMIRIAPQGYPLALGIALATLAAVVVSIAVHRWIERPMTQTLNKLVNSGRTSAHGRRVARA